MKKTLLCAGVAAALSAVAAHAQAFNAGQILVRARAVGLQSDNSDSSQLGLAVNNKILPEVDVSYFIDSHVSAELSVTVPQSQTVTTKGAYLGTLSHQPTTLMLQYHFDAPTIKPYLGLGVNYTRFSAVNLLNGAVDIDHASWGVALQAGFDLPLSQDVYLNVDVKKIGMATGVYAAGSKLGTFRVNPWWVGVGVGWAF